MDESKAQHLKQFGKTLTIYQTHVSDVSVGDIRIGSLQVAAIPLKVLGEKLGVPIHGILGDGFLKNRSTRIDFVNRKISFAPRLKEFSEDLDAADHIASLETNPNWDMPLVKVSYKGMSFLATIDTGSSLGLEVFSPFVEEQGLAEKVKNWDKSDILGGSLGKATAYDGTLDEIAIGPLQFTNVPTSITPTRADPNRKGNIGNKVWKDYVVIFAYPEKKIIWRKITKKPTD